MVLIATVLDDWIFNEVFQSKRVIFVNVINRRFLYSQFMQFKTKQTQGKSCRICCLAYNAVSRHNWNFRGTQKKQVLNKGSGRHRNTRACWRHLDWIRCLVAADWGRRLTRLFCPGNKLLNLHTLFVYLRLYFIHFQVCHHLFSAP